MNRLRAPYFIVANTAILVLVVELGTHAAVTLLRSGPPEVRFEQLPEPVRRNYAHMRPEDVEDLLRVTAALRFRFAATGGLVHEERKTRFVNINHHGIRANGTGRREIAMQGAVWALGGSTTFGSGVADHETIPAQLERILGQPVINLGVRGDGSLMENRLLNYYLRIGYRPAMAIFLDGINEACRSDVFGHELSDLVARSQQGYQWTLGMPVTYAYEAVRRRAKQLAGAVDQPEPLDLTCTDDRVRNPLRVIHARILAERASLCALYGIPCRTFVQPFATLHGRHDDHTFAASASATHLRALFDHLEATWREQRLIFITGALDRSDHHAFIDEIHYSANANRLIAEAIAAGIDGPGTRQ